MNFNFRLDRIWRVQADEENGSLEKLNSMKSEDDKLQYYAELIEIYEKLEEFKEEPN